MELRSGRRLRSCRIQYVKNSENGVRRTVEFSVKQIETTQVTLAFYLCHSFFLSVNLCCFSIFSIIGPQPSS